MLSMPIAFWYCDIVGLVRLGEFNMLMMPMYHFYTFFYQEIIFYDAGVSLILISSRNELCIVEYILVW